MKPYRAHKNSGAALVVSLIILLVLTLLGVAGIGGATLEMKLTAATKERALAFEAAEAILRSVEQRYVATPPTLSQFFANASCSGKDCDKCSQGICFKGKFDGSDPEACAVLDSTFSAYSDFLSDPTHWKTVGNYATEEHTYYDTTKEDVKYFVEFLCFAPKAGGVEVATPTNTLELNNNLAMVLRITAQATGPSGRSVVNLQSVIKAPKL